MSCVNSARPSSGCRGCFPLSAATTTGLRPGVALPPASPLSRATCQLLPHSDYGVVDQRPWTDRPLLGGCGKVTSRPWQFQWVTKANLHVTLLTLSAWSMRFVPTAFRPSDVARGFVWDPLIPGRDLNYMFPADT